MPYGNYGYPPPSAYGGGGYSANPVSSGPGPTYGAGSAYGGGFVSGADQPQAMMSQPVSPDQSRYDAGSSGGGMGAGGWMALFQMIGDKLEGRRAAQAAAAAAAND